MQIFQNVIPCPPFVTTQSILDDMNALPPRKTLADKYYLGYFDSEQNLVAVMDLIDHCPTAGGAFIGFFMMERDLQGQGIGSQIIEDLSECLKRWGYQFIRLGYVNGNLQTDTGMRNHTNGYTVILMNRDL